ncbi:MAG: pilus assembly protein [Planctomycetes bacterium]|nr:pilus assembly protein [Planctomycetota bacterium]
MPFNSNVPRRGSVLVEFALIALILFLLLGFTFDMGRALYSAQILQQAADLMARELSHTPLPASSTFQDALKDPQVQNNIYNKDDLAIDITPWMNSPGNQTLLEFLDNNLTPPLPPGNKILVPLMTPLNHSQNPIIPEGKTLLVYPGALIPSRTAKSGFTVQIPILHYSPGSEEIIDWVDVVEPIQPDMFSIMPPPSISPQSPPPPRGMVGLRINYPFQGAMLTDSWKDPNNPTNPSPMIQAPADEQLQPGQQGGPYSGPTGLGQQAAYGTTVRPFRKVLSAQAIYRREIFQ